MLQQTQVKTVLERFYFPFLECFPTLQDLAHASEDEVLKMWEGLGYYTRARHMHRAAQSLQHELPQSVHELMRLPGIGRSTAHAIAAFAYQTPVPILDANVKRILYRFFGKKRLAEKALWDLAYQLFDEEHPFEYNQAMMDLGSLVCRARDARCHHCPLHSGCTAAKTDPLNFPEKKQKRAVPIRRKDIVVITCKNRYALKQRRSRFLKGLWGFIEYETNTCSDEKKLGALIQKYSHFHLHADVYIRHEYDDTYDYFTLEEICKLPLSQADIKIVNMLK